MRNILPFILFIIKMQATTAQDLQQQALSPEAFFSTVTQYHPLARQADIGIKSSDAQLLLAKGMFDPVLSAGESDKTFDGINYYRSSEGSINIPTWYGIELYAGAGLLTGDRTDPTQTRGRTNFAGISIPVAKNLLMDKRRAALKTAAVLQSMSLVERETVLNDLVLEAAVAYWSWAASYEFITIAEDAVQVNERRLQLLRSTVELGERAAIDTVEALAQLQAFRYLMNESKLQFLNAGAYLSTFLWLPDGTALDLLPGVKPPAGMFSASATESNQSFPNNIDSVADAHPKLREFQFKLKALDINRRLKFQEVLPAINLKYNQLGKGYNVAKTAAAFLSENNYRFGLSFSFPLRISAGRAEYKLAKLKIDETILMRVHARQTLLSKIQAARNEYANILKQLNVQEEILNNYIRLQLAEEAKFSNGESSLFLVNSRENKVIEARQKLLEIKMKYFIAVAKMKNASGIR